MTAGVDPSQYADNSELATAMAATKRGAQPVGVPAATPVTPLPPGTRPSAPAKASNAETMDVAAHTTKVLDTARVAKVVALSGDIEIEIYKCKVRQFSKVARLLSIVLSTANITSVDQLTTGVKVPPAMILQIMEDAQGPLIDAVVALSTLREADIDDMEIEDFLEVALAVWEVNRDYFFARVLPKVAELLGTAEPADSAVES